MDAYGVVNGTALFVAPEALVELGLTAFQSDQREWLALGDALGVAYNYDADSGDVRISCASSCFVTRVLGALERDAPLARSDPGAFVNVDGVLTSVQGSSKAAGAFEAGVFGAHGFGEASWTIGASQGGDITRLETSWTWDDPVRRVRYRIGDSIARSGAATDAFRFGGVQIARDFTLEPGFVTTPTPTLSGVATLPSVVDLYVNGALRLRERVEAGPFTIADPPIVTGAGNARIVVTDVLGRQQIASQRFYAGREMLRPGLSDFSLAFGALRERFSIDSADYGRAVASGLYRRGVTEDFTAEVRGETSGGAGILSMGASWTPGDVGQFDAALAKNLGGADQGALVRLGWMRSSSRFYFSADVEATDEAFSRVVGANITPRTSAAVSAGLSSRRYGSFSVSATQADSRDTSDITTAAIDYVPAPSRFGTVGFNLLMTDDGDREVSAVVSLATVLGQTRSVSQSVATQDGRLSVQARAQQIPLPEGGLGWRVGARAGDNPRFEAGLTLRGRLGEGDIEVSRAWMQNGVRAQAAFGLVWIDGGLRVSRPVRDSFALVDVGAPNVRVLRENIPVGVTGADGRLLVTALRPYERNHLGIEADDLPHDTPVTVDALTATPGPRGGVVVRFPVEVDAAGEAYVVDEQGAPLPVGAMLTANGQRFPVGHGGRVFLTGLREQTILRKTGADACIALIDRESLASPAPIVCRRGA